MTEKKRRGKLLMASVQTAKLTIRIEIEAAKATPAQHAMFERMQEAVCAIYKAKVEADPVPASALPADTDTAGKPQHVCGLQGFGRGVDGLSDVCPACTPPFPAVPNQSEKL